MTSPEELTNLAGLFTALAESWRKEGMRLVKKDNIPQFSNPTEITTAQAIAINLNGVLRNCAHEVDQLVIKLEKLAK